MLVELEQFGAEQPPIAELRATAKINLAKSPDSLAGNAPKRSFLILNVTFSCPTSVTECKKSHISIN